MTMIATTTTCTSHQLMSPPSATPTKSILRNIQTSSSVLGNRKRSDDDDATIGADLPSPLKRKKSVHFNMNLNVTAEVGKRSLESTKAEIRLALDNHDRGDDLYYRELIELFTTDRQGPDSDDEEAVAPEELITYIVALASYAPLLTKSCGSLIKELLQVSWLGRDDNFHRAYTQLIASIISARGSYTQSVVGMMVDKFRTYRRFEWAARGFPDVSRDTMQARLHNSLLFILQLFPAARPVLLDLMSHKFPCSDESKHVHLTFVDNLLYVRRGAPNLGAEIMELITDRTVKLDVLFQLDLDDMDDEVVPHVLLQHNNSLANDTEFDDDSDAESVSSIESDENTAEKRIERAAELVAKLDGTLDKLFGVYEDCFSEPGSEQELCFENILSDFTNVVLTTFRSRHTQFVIFHFSQKSPQLMDCFIGTLLNISFESNRSATLRQAAVAYLSSFAARGSHVPRETVRQITSLLLAKIQHYNDKAEETLRAKGVHAGIKRINPDLRKYRQLYAYFQALIYLFCFRWRDLIDSYPDSVDEDDVSTYEGREVTWMPLLRSTILNSIYSDYNPLKVCDPVITTEFVKLADILLHTSLFLKIDQNKRINLAQCASGAYSNGGALRDAGIDMDEQSWHQLEASFPFDPYHLPLSKRWLTGDYIPWTPIPVLNKVEEEEEDDDDDSDDDEDSDLGDLDILEQDTATDDE